MDWKASDEIIKQRQEICRSCDKYISSTYVCSVCGCVTTLTTTVKEFECPLLKWTRVDRYTIEPNGNA